MVLIIYILKVFVRLNMLEKLKEEAVVEEEPPTKEISEELYTELFGEPEGVVHQEEFEGFSDQLAPNGSPVETDKDESDSATSSDSEGPTTDEETDWSQNSQRTRNPKRIFTYDTIGTPTTKVCGTHTNGTWV